MPFSFSAEQTALRSAVRDFADSVATLAATRAVLDSDLGYDAATWRRLSTELGVTALAVPEESGGAGAGTVELAIVAEELGRVLYSGPWLSTVLAASAIARDPAAAADLLPAIVGEGAAATVAVSEALGSWDPADVECAALEGPDGWTLTGAKHYVAHAVGASLIVVVARSTHGLGLYAVPTAAAGVTVTPVTGFDLTRRLSRVDLDNASARLIGHEQSVTDLIRLAAILSAAESVGGANASLDLAVAYAKYRVQFGRVIGSFQSIKHMCADALLDVESARSAAYYAAWAADDTPDELPTVVPLAKAFCSDVFFNTAKDSHQIHGGISFTWEHDCHLYYRRAKSSRQLWGDPPAHRELLATAIGL